ncbi:transglycosylase domain-containing protein [Sphingomonas sp. ID1715]|uniref:biosynthetic peptidoglycan transglycosylase n=1 Tax=Sphingomonas sp. ID1715 TaxID=1656898 RepID=UPI001487A4F7|nr:transglycosylase domain-containing protein [Sphingomonas sp. ID1715]
MFLLQKDIRAVDAVISQHGRTEIDNEFLALLVQAEDRRFWRHNGVDWRSVARAAVGWATCKSQSGASTIEMQLVRTVTGKYEISITRKLREMIISMGLRRKWCKASIIATYACVGYFGEEVRGAEDAALALHKRRLDECSRLRKALVAATLRRPIPGRRSREWCREVLRRARYILRHQVEAPTLAKCRQS